jgi:hypothetical protein
MAASEQDVEALEREHVEELARVHAALAEAQDRSYWLDRWGVDLNHVMLRPGARRARAALRAARELQRGAIAVRRYARARAGDLHSSSREDEIAVAASAAREREPSAGSANGTAPRP